jgi:hypothetical protein
MIHDPVDQAFIRRTRIVQNGLDRHLDVCWWKLGGCLLGSLIFCWFVLAAFSMARVCLYTVHCGWKPR